MQKQVLQRKKCSKVNTKNMRRNCMNSCSIHITTVPPAEIGKPSHGRMNCNVSGEKWQGEVRTSFFPNASFFNLQVFWF
jgi:hypothetical protein